MPDLEISSLLSGYHDDKRETPDEGIAVCLSGGGFRAMLFHTGVLWRLLETGLISPGDRSVVRPGKGSTPIGTLRRVSSVSGGSIVSALLGLKWPKLRFDTSGNRVRTFQAEVLAPVRDLARVTLASRSLKGAASLVTKIIAPGSVSDHVARAYDKHLYGGAKLDALPTAPRWVINASNLQSGALWRFMAPYMRDWKVGENRHTRTIPLARAVAASSAFPPFLAPARFSFRHEDFTPGTGGSGKDDLQRPPYTTDVSLADGGVYDNLGLETAYKRYRTLLVSDAGAPFEPQPKVALNWVSLGFRVIGVVDSQVRALRRRLLVHALATEERYGAFWSIDADISALSAPGKLPCPHEQTLALAALPTDLGAKDERTQERLINWGYALCDASVRSWLDTSLAPPTGFPFPESGVGGP